MSQKDPHDTNQSSLSNDEQKKSHPIMSQKRKQVCQSPEEESGSDAANEPSMSTSQGNKETMKDPKGTEKDPKYHLETRKGQYNAANEDRQGPNPPHKRGPLHEPNNTLKTKQQNYLPQPLTKPNRQQPQSCLLYTSPSPRDS